MSKTVAVALSFAALLIGATAASAQPSMDSTAWCEDSATWCTQTSAKRAFVSGVRFLAEPKLGTAWGQGDNRVESSGFGKLTLVGAEVNLFGALVSAQGALITPGSVTLDAQSPLVTSKRLADPQGNLNVDYGLAVGLSFFDGGVAIGFGRLNYDIRGIVSPAAAEGHSTFWYLNLQAVSAVRATIKRLKH